LKSLETFETVNIEVAEMGVRGLQTVVQAE
jgi:hypothetical protein